MHDALHEPDLGVRWAEAVCREVTGAPAFDRDALLAADADAFVAAHERLLASAEFRGTRGGALPIRDGSLPAAPMEAPGARKGIDVLVGTTADEGTFFFRVGGRNIDPSDDELLRIAGHLPGVNDGPAAVAAYSAGSYSETLVRLATHAMVAVPAAAWATARARPRAADGGRVHRYRVEHRSPQPGLGAVHTIDVPLVFGSFADDEGARAMSGDASDVSEALQGVVRAFVRGEDPGWPSLQANDSAQTVAVFGGPAPIRYEAERQPQLLS